MSAFLGGLALCGAEVYVVGGKGPQGVATIAEGVAKLKPGDTLKILPGTYHERIKIPCDNVTIVGGGPGVVLDGSKEVPPADFKPVDGRKGVFSWALPKGAPTWRGTRPPWMWYNGVKLLWSDKPLDPEKNQMSFHIDHKTKRLEINIDGKPLAPDAEIVVPVVDYLVDATGRNDVRNLRVEYCHVYLCGGGIYCQGDAHIAHNTARLCNASGIGQGGSDCLIENNLVTETRISWDNVQRWAGTIKHNSSSRSTYRQNWILENPQGGLTNVGHRKVVRIWKFASGLWPDINCYNNSYVNNAVARVGHAGVYIEHTSKRNVVMYNAIQDCSMGITFRQGSENIALRNWVWDRDFLGWGKLDTTGYCSWGHGYDEQTGKPLTEFQEHPMWGRQHLEGICLWHAFDGMDEASVFNSVIGNLIQVSGRAVSVPFASFELQEQAVDKDGEKRNVPVDAKKKWVHAPMPGPADRGKIPPPRPFTNSLDGNYYDRPAGDSDFAWLGNKVARTFEQYRKATGWDTNGHQGRFTTSVIGLEPLWTIPWAAREKDMPVAILHDPSFETASSLQFREPLFWHASHIRPGYAMRPPATAWQPARTIKDQGRGGGRCLYILGASKVKKRVRGKVIDEDFTETIGWTSASVPVMPGTTMGMDFWMKCADVKPSKPGTGAVVAMRFVDSCGFPAGETVLVGAGGDDKRMSGNFDWVNVKGESKVPKTARWMSVFMGLQPADGKVCYDDVRINLVDPAPPSFDKRK